MSPPSDSACCVVSACGIKHKAVAVPFKPLHASKTVPSLITSLLHHFPALCVVLPAALRFEQVLIRSQHVLLLRIRKTISPGLQCCLVAAGGSHSAAKLTT
jgi:hypothetical protein